MKTVSSINYLNLIQFNSIQFIIYLFSMVKTIQNKKFNNAIVTYVTTIKVMTKTITVVTKNGQI